MIKNLVIGFSLLSSLLCIIASVRIYTRSLKLKAEDPTDKEIKQAAAGIGVSLFLWFVAGILLFIAYKISE